MSSSSNSKSREEWRERVEKRREEARDGEAGRRERERELRKKAKVSSSVLMQK